MKLAFSQAQPDYKNHIYPYAIWALPEEGETPADFFEKGFLPSVPELTRFYLCRTLRVRLREFTPSSENRRVLRKGEGIRARLIPRSDFQCSPERKQLILHYAQSRFGEANFSEARLERLLASPMLTHILEFTSKETNERVGEVFMYLESKRVAYYYFSFYDLKYFEQNIGMFMMTSAVKLFAELGFDAIYLGTCYSRSALYKTQFAGLEFGTGFAWSDSVEELKYLITRDSAEPTSHLLESDEYLEKFYVGREEFMKKVL